MLKIVLAGDNHGDIDSIKRILIDNPQADYYFHTGDSQMNPKYIEPFISVCGNNDYNTDLPKFRVIDIKEHKILLIHGHGYTYSTDALVYKAQEEGCDIVFFGHTHVYFDKTVNGIRLINPGSTFYARNLDEPSYAIVTIDENDIKAKQIYL